MKKLFLVCSLSLCFVACTERVEQIPEVIASQNVQASIESENPRAVVVSFTFTPGRQSKDCKGFGVCELVAFGIGIIELPPKPETPKADIFAESNGKFTAHYLLAEANQLSDTTLYIDNDLTGTDENDQSYIIKSGAYAIDYSMGEFGGYVMDVEKL